jgi:hypothetical protein
MDFFKVRIINPCPLNVKENGFMNVQIRGAVVRARKSFVEKHFGAGAWEKVIAAMPQEDRELFKGILVHTG